jgi:hypothetical protein
MLWLIKILIFGKMCNHDWILLQKMEPWSNHCLYLYKCSKCGKITKKKLLIRNYVD